MTKKSIIEAELEARRFLRRVEEYKKAQALEEKKYICLPNTHRSAIRRSSMDLTRALAKLRRYEFER